MARTVCVSVFWVCVVVLFYLASSASGSDPDTEFLWHWRHYKSANHEYVEGKTDARISKYEIPNGRFDSNGQIHAYLKSILQDHTEVFDKTLDKLLSIAFERSEEPITHEASDQCNTNTTYGDPWSVRQAWRDFKEKARDGNEMCPVCPLFFGIMKALVCNVDYIPARDILIWACEWLLPQIDSHPGMCEGVITLQAPYVFTTLKESAPYDFCETLNTCYPPPENDTPSVTQRLAHILDPERRIRNVESHEPGPINSNDRQIKFVQITDVHVQPIYATGSPTDCDMYICCTDRVQGKGEARMYGEYRCNLPERTMLILMDKLVEIDPDFIIFSGDAPPHTIWEETLTSQLNCTDILRKALMDKVPGTTVYPNIGNHEMYPTNVYARRVNFTKIMNDAFTEMWKELAHFGPEQESTMRYLGYYSTLVGNYTLLRLLSLNFNHYWYNLNFMATLNRNTTDEQNQRQFVVDELSRARQHGEKVIVVAHHPVGSHSSIIRATRWWEQVAREFHDVILMLLSGHTHNDEFHLILDPESLKPLSINYVAPSVTTNTNINPSLKVFYLDPTTFVLDKTEHFYVDLDQQEPNNPPPVRKNDDILELYGMDDLSLNSWLDLSIRFMEDDVLFQTWYSNRFARAINTACTEGCKFRLICRMWFPNLDESEECVKLLSAIPPPPSPTTDNSTASSNKQHRTLAGLLIVIASIVKYM